MWKVLLAIGAVSHRLTSAAISMNARAADIAPSLQLLPMALPEVQDRRT